MSRAACKVFAVPGFIAKISFSCIAGANELKMSLSRLFCMHPSLVFLVFMFLLSHGASVPVSGGMPWRCSPRVNGSESGFCLAGGRESFCHVFQTSLVIIRVHCQQINATQLVRFNLFIILLANSWQEIFLMQDRRKRSETTIKVKNVLHSF